MTGLEMMMKYAHALFARLGLHEKADASDAFDLRLRKIEQREATRCGQQSLFKNSQSRRAA
jgi:hypothetical protein